MKIKTLISAAFMLTGCTINETLVHDPELNLMFQPEMYMHVSQEGTVRFPTEENFAVRAWMLPQNVSWNEGIGHAIEYMPLSEAYSREVTITDSDTRIAAKDTLWGTSETLLWPSSNDNLTFLAYAPFGAECNCDIENGISFHSDVLLRQEDILFTEPQADRHKIEDGWVVPLQFSHALCKVNFRIKNRVPEREEILIRRIAISSAYTKGHFSSFRTPQWIQEGTPAEILFFEGESPTDNLPTDIGSGLMMIPQKLDTRITLDYDYQTSGGARFPMHQQTSVINTELEAGHSYTYTLSVGIDDVKLMQEIIGDIFE